jgi:hypothetical protein
VRMEVAGRIMFVARSAISGSSTPTATEHRG